MPQLYQKYRPFKWEELVGNQKAIKELQNRVIQNNIPNSIYMSGISGTGKTTAARLLAACITCENLDKEKGNPCGNCMFCEDVLQESFSLAVYFYNASNIAIDEMRSIDDIARTKSLTSKKKIIIIDELQELSNNKKAMKSILVTLEKQSKDVYFILLAMDDSKVDNAIKNRCVPYKLQPIEDSEIAKYLNLICKQEKIELSENQFGAIFALAENSGGSVRTAVSYLERCIEGNIWNEQEIVKELGIISQIKLIDIVGKLLAGDVSVLTNDLSSDILSKIRWTLSLTYKKKAGVNLNSFQSSQVGKLDQYPLEAIQYAVQKMNDVNSFIYTDWMLIESLLLDICMKNKVIPRRKL